MAESAKRAQAASMAERAWTARQSQNDSAHDKFWPRLEGRHLYGSCHNTQKHLRLNILVVE